MPLSTELADAVRELLDLAAQGQGGGPEMAAIQPLLEVQARWSVVPRRGRFLIEQIKSREGHHTYFYPFAGRLVHEGLASLLAYRLAMKSPITFSMSVNDYGFELLSRKPLQLDTDTVQQLLSSQQLDEHIQACLNQTELAKRQFREIAAISGLVFTGYPGSRKSTKQLQASAGLLFDVFREYDRGNRLLGQAEQEVLERHLEHHRLRATLLDLQAQPIELSRPERFTPLCFPLLVDRLRSRLSSESLSQRVERMLAQLERAVNLDDKEDDLGHERQAD